MNKGMPNKKWHFSWSIVFLTAGFDNSAAFWLSKVEGACVDRVQKTK
jgi:hypothetical protein